MLVQFINQLRGAQRDEIIWIIISFLIAIFAFLLSLIIHEVAHGYVALWNGDKTAKFNKRLTLNPARHLDPMGTAMFLIVGIGYAKPVPINPENFKNRKRGMALVSIAGVSVNLILAFFSSMFVVIMKKFAGDPLSYSNALYCVYYFFRYMSNVNLFLMLFNFLPIYPLDGYRLVEALTKFTNKFTKFLRNYGMFILLGLVILGAIQSMFGLPYFVDLLGTYLDTVSGYILRGFQWFWGLIFGL